MDKTVSINNMDNQSTKRIISTDLRICEEKWLIIKFNNYAQCLIYVNIIPKKYNIER